MVRPSCRTSPAGPTCGSCGRRQGRYGHPPALEDALDLLAGLGDALDRKVKGYSMGMKQRLMLAQALMRKPDVLILDEPANGLDPGEVRALREHLGELVL
ncbi:ATP-binding cassette domain-containing protein [Streptomyces noursei]|uniref:ATP-binding cassette domain-containing protein n=1 Tax=Streptomyces noursei TaxID=1971 RepID=UPI00381A12E6